MDVAEFEAFVVGRSGALLRFGHMVSADRRSAEDLVQGALAVAFRHRRRLDAEGVESYVRRCIVNAQATRWRRLLRREQTVAEMADLPVDDGAGRVDDRLWAVQALRALPPRQRAVVVLRYRYDLDTKAIALELGVAEGTVKSQAAKALKTMRAAAGPLEEAQR